jgi:hypothetical protein
MTLRVVGAGLGRTGTHSLKLALEQLLGGRCYHMLEVFEHPEHIQHWQDAVDGKPIDWDALFEGYTAAVDWPEAAFYEELSERYPDAVVLLSTRRSADAWWDSANATIFEISRREVPPDVPDSLQRQIKMAHDMFDKTFTPDWDDPDAAKRAYEKHNETVRETIAADRLLDWQPGDGWGPICAALDVPVPDEPFPHVNSTDEFRAMLDLDA